MEISQSTVNRIGKAVAKAAAQGAAQAIAVEFASGSLGMTSSQPSQPEGQPQWGPTFHAETSPSGQQKELGNSGRLYATVILSTSPEESQTAEGLLRQAGGKPFTRRIQ
jgi:hypothetical protein